MKWPAKAATFDRPGDKYGCCDSITALSERQGVIDMVLCIKDGRECNGCMQCRTPVAATTGAIHTEDDLTLRPLDCTARCAADIQTISTDRNTAAIMRHRKQTA